jgi:predicted NAD/FAD-dependent oxidoreductase
VVGAGLTGAACATRLAAEGIPVRVVERAHAPGGRMASPSWEGRRVDLGAAYFTVSDPLFARAVDAWWGAGLVRRWTETLDVLTPAGFGPPAPGPMRWAAPDGLRSLVASMLGQLSITLETTVTDLPSDGPVVLAMPDPQARRILPVVGGVEWIDYEPTIALAARWPTRSWSLRAAAFVNDHPELSLIADDGSRRGDGAPVLVAHSTPAFAQRHLDRPESAGAPMVAAVRELLDLDEPAAIRTHRWTFAKPSAAHPTSYWLSLDGRLGLAGDAWCPIGAPRIESAFRSGVDLAEAIINRG